MNNKELEANSNRLRDQWKADDRIFAVFCGLLVALVYMGVIAVIGLGNRHFVLDRPLWFWTTTAGVFALVATLTYRSAVAYNARVEAAVEEVLQELREDPFLRFEPVEAFELKPWRSSTNTSFRPNQPKTNPTKRSGRQSKRGYQADRDTKRAMAYASKRGNRARRR